MTTIERYGVILEELAELIFNQKQTIEVRDWQISELEKKLKEAEQIISDANRKLTEGEQKRVHSMK